MRSVIVPLPNQQQSVGSIQVTGSNNQVIIQQNSDGEGRNSDVSRNDVPATAEASLSTGWTWFFGIAFALITLLALPVLVNLLTGQNPLPGWLQAIVPYSAPLIGASLFLLGVLFLWQTRLQRRGAISPGGLAQHDRIEIPSRDTLLTKSRNIHQESEDAFERAVDVQLGIHRVPQLVVAQHLPHIAARATTAARPLTEPLVDYLLRVEKLLLVGAPGAGKSATLRTLWGELLSLAQSDSSLPVPFLLNLSTFSQYVGTFRNWLAESLRECAGIPLAIGQVLLEAGQLFLLLDGLDEMAESRRAAALTELNELLTAADPSLHRCVVCSRTLEYNQAGVVLHLPAAVELQPLTVAQVQEVVAGAGPAAQPLAAALKNDLALAELLATPLLLTVAVRSVAGQSQVIISGNGSAELRQALFNEYIAQMLKRSDVRCMMQSLRLLRCLQWLARNIIDQQSTMFLIERLQIDSLRAKWKYNVLLLLLFSLVGGLGSGIFGMMFGALFGTCVAGLTTGRVQAVERMSWSWFHMKESWSWRRLFRDGLVFGLSIGLLDTIDIWVGFTEVGGRLGNGLLSWLVVGMASGIAIQLSHGWWKSLSAQTIRPNQGIHASVRNGLTQGWTTGFSGGLIVGLVAMVSFGLDGVLIFGLAGTLVGALRGGLGEAIKHYALRICLRFEVGLPLRLVPFLEQCRSMLLLRREGGGYRFWHVTLQEHFAALDDARMNDIAERSLATDAYQAKY